MQNEPWRLRTGAEEARAFTHGLRALRTRLTVSFQPPWASVCPSCWSHLLKSPCCALPDSLLGEDSSKKAEPCDLSLAPRDTLTFVEPNSTSVPGPPGVVSSLLSAAQMAAADL